MLTIEISNNRSFLVGYCSFKMGRLQTLKFKTVRHVLEMLFEVNKTSGTSNLQLQNAWVFIEKSNLSN